jgi:hypothetical protein
MLTAPSRTAPELERKRPIEDWFFTVMALAMIATASMAFVPSIIHPEERHAPLSALAAAHGVVFFAWLLLFLIQSRLIATRHVAWHRRLGLASVAILAWMIPLAYTATIAMVRRGYDLSGDLRIDRDPPHAIVFQLCNLLIFSALAIAALAYRRRPEIHKRLMLFANIELMPAPLAHLIGHTPWLASAASSDCHGANLDLRNRCHRPGLAAGEASSPAHVGTCDFEDGLRAARGRSFGFERGLASLCLPAGWIALNETGERDELHV